MESETEVGGRGRVVESARGTLRRARKGAKSAWHSSLQNLAGWKESVLRPTAALKHRATFTPGIGRSGEEPNC